MSTKQIIIRELERGGDIADKIFTGQLQWKDLFSKHSFFTDDYKYYLSIVSASRTKDAQQVWSGLVESKVRLLVSNLENQGSIQVARPFNKGFDRVHKCKKETEVEFIINGDMSYQATGSKTETTDAVKDPKHTAIAEGGAEGMAMPNGGDEHDAGVEGMNTIYTTTYYVGIELAQGEHIRRLKVDYLTLPDTTKRLDISYQTKEFKDICLAWQNYDSELNSLNIIHTRK